MEYEIKITGSGTLQQLKDALAAIAANINVDDVYDDGYEDEGPYLMTEISTYSEDDKGDEDNDEEEGWVCTNPDSKQYRRKLSDKIWEFRNDRNYSVIDLNDYSLAEMRYACKTFGYDSVVVLKWWTYGENLEIIAECIFELKN